MNERSQMSHFVKKKYFNCFHNILYDPVVVVVVIIIYYYYYYYYSFLQPPQRGINLYVPLRYGAINKKTFLKCTNTNAVKNLYIITCCWSLQGAVKWLNFTLPCQIRKNKFHTKKQLPGSTVSAYWHMGQSCNTYHGSHRAKALYFECDSYN